MITIGNKLHFLEYFDDKIIYMKTFLLSFSKVRYTHLFLVFFFFAQMQKDLNEKRSCVQVFSAILNRVARPNTLVRSRSPRS